MNTFTDIAREILEQGEPEKGAFLIKVLDERTTVRIQTCEAEPLSLLTLGRSQNENISHLKACEMLLTETFLSCLSDSRVGSITMEEEYAVTIPRAASDRLEKNLETDLQLITELLNDLDNQSEEDRNHSVAPDGDNKSDQHWVQV